MVLKYGLDLKGQYAKGGCQSVALLEGGETLRKFGLVGRS